MKKITTAAVRTTSGGIYRAKHHKDLSAKGVKGEKGFIASDGSFVDRTTAAKIAVGAGQVPSTIKSLRSEQLEAYKGKKKATGNL